MTPRVTWDSLSGVVCRSIAAMGEAGAPGREGWTPLHDRGSPRERRVSPGRVCLPGSPGPACITLVLLLCALVQLAAASLQLPASSSATTRVLHHSEALTQHVSLTNTTLPVPHDASTTQGISGAGEPRHHPAVVKSRRRNQSRHSSGQIVPAAAMTTSAARAPPPRRPERQAPHNPARATRAITAVRRVELHGPPLTHRQTLYVEVVVLADHTFYKHHGTRQNALQRVAHIMGVANRVLGGVGVVLVPADVQVLNRRDQMPTASNLDTTVERLQRHRLELLTQYPDQPNDHTLLLTRKQMRRRGSCGAPLQGMCRTKQSVSVVQDEGEGPGVTGAALAHQVGHSLGMQDDAKDADPACPCDAATCVMSRHSSNASTRTLAWSACSRQSLDSAMDTLALDCLRNVPTRMHPSPSCGDGVVDEGEQCDCGHAEVCDNPCCVAATCTLAAKASCASGSCCDIQTCRPKPPGVECRAAATDCDLPEFCSGHSEYCAKDVTKIDGDLCRGGHCFSGACGSREGRCRRVWGPSAAAASPDCSSKLNVRGTHAGNCGPESRGFRRCRQEESLCGTLHCIAPARPSRLLPDHRNGSARAGLHECHFISGSENYPAHHWLTPDGAQCGSGKMCIKQRCEEVPRPAGDCSGGCSGNGVCNSLDHCHCYAGYAPPNCSLAGLGGSVDSNVMSDVSDPWLPLTVAWVVVVLLLSLLGVTCCCWGCVKGWYKRKGRDNLSGSIPWCAACLDACCCPIMTKTARWMLTVGSSPEKKLMNRNIEVNEGENEDMLCSVDLEIKSTAETSSWGVASEKLVTELVTITPKDSPDTHRKVRLPSESPLQHHKSEDNLRRPNYLQSISMDSGCVSDSEDDDASNKRDSLKLSMSSLLSVLMKVGDKKPKTMKDSEHQLSMGTGSQKSIPLSRFVVDPLAGRRGARHGTPPPHHARPAYNRSISTDIISTRQNRKEGTPPPPPPSALKPNKSEENLSKAFESPSRGRFPPHRQHSPPTDTSTRASASPEKFIHENGARDPPTPTSGKAPLMPSKNKLLPPPPEKFIHKNGTRDPPTSTSGKAPLMPTKNKPLPSLPLKRNTPSPPQTGSQRHHGGSLNKRPIPPSGASRPSPPKTSSGVKGSLQDTAASKKVLEMTRKFEAA